MRHKILHTGVRPIKFLDLYNNTPKTKASYSSALLHLNNFLLTKKSDYDSIIDEILADKVSVYDVLREFIEYITKTRKGISELSITNYLAAIRSYFAFYDIIVTHSKFKRKIKRPRPLREKEAVLAKDIIRDILQNCTNRRLKPYLLVLASSGARAVEALALRKKDINLDSIPATIHIRPEFTKTKRSRDIFISNESVTFLKQWLQYKDEYNDRNKKRIEAWKHYSELSDTEKKKIPEDRIPAKVLPKTYTDSDLIFTEEKNTTPNIIYQRVLSEFQQLLRSMGKDERKENSMAGRRKITLHRFRSYVKTKIAKQTNTDYSEWFLGHDGSPYWNTEEEEKESMYMKCMLSELTFLDYRGLENRDKNIESQLEQFRKENQKLVEEQRIMKDQFRKEMEEMKSLMFKNLVSESKTKIEELKAKGITKGYRKTPPTEQEVRKSYERSKESLKGYPEDTHIPKIGDLLDPTETTYFSPETHPDYEKIWNERHPDKPMPKFFINIKEDPDNIMTENSMSKFAEPEGWKVIKKKKK